MKLTLIYLVSIFFILFSSCKEDPSSPDPDPTPTDPNVNKYLVELPEWDIFCPQLPKDDSQSDPTTDWECATQVVETTTPCSITRTPEEIVTYDPGSEILYVGSLIQGKKYIGGLGSIQALPINQRAPIKISISFQMANNNKTIENPSLTTVKSAIGDLVESAQNAGHKSGSSIFFNKSSSYSVDQTILNLGLSAKFMKGSVKASLNWTSTTEEHTVSAYFVQKMYTVSMEIPQRPGDFFSSEFTKELLDEQISLGRIGPDNLPVYVSNIVYGRVMTLTMTSTYNETEMKAALEGSYNNIGGTVSAEHLQILEESDIQLVTIGGDAQQALDFLREGNLGVFFQKDAPLTTAVPISYTLRNVGDNVVATVSETTSYDMVQYEPASITTYTSEGAWYAAVLVDEEKFVFDGPNVSKADESGSFVEGGGGQWFLGKKITYNGANTGYEFNFELENMGVTGSPIDALVWNDNEGFTQNSISIGDIDNWENDDFEIRVSGTADVYAIAFWVEGNSDGSTEYLRLYAADGTGDCQIGGNINGHINNFFGVVSNVPLKRIYFNESGDGDDIALNTLFFGYK